MFNPAKLEEVVLSQRERFEARDVGLIRRVALRRVMAHDRVVVISGVRRCGKSTLLAQIARRYDSFHFMDFDDERLIDFTTQDFAELMVVFTKHSPAKTLFLDEIQNVIGWERFVRRVHDEGYKVYLTGSNARLLSGELATHLTGRYSKIELYPFSYAELLDYREISAEKISASVRARLMAALDDYLEWGGFPELLKYDDDEFLKRTYDDVVYRDIVRRFGIRDIKAFRQLAHFIFSNATKELSYNSMASMVGFKNAMTVRNYCGYLEESYLIFEVFRYDYSVKRQNLSNKKLFVIDNGMRNMVAFSFSRDLGRKLENLVFLELKRRGQQIYFHRESHECDFLIEDRGVIVDAVQVCYALDAQNRERERRGLLEVMRKFSLPQGTIVTYGQNEVETTDDGVIRVVPAYLWLLDFEMTHRAA